MYTYIEEKMRKRERITDEECLELFSYDISTLGALATLRKKQFHDTNVVTYVVDVNINVTNVCDVACDFCAFYVSDAEKGFVLSVDEVLRKVERLVSIGGTQVMIQGGISSRVNCAYYGTLFRAIKERFPVYIHALSPPEIMGLARLEAMEVRAVLETLRAQGLDSLPGGGAELLVDRVRSLISPRKITAQEWLSVMRTAHMLGMESTATMMFGSVETQEERVMHLRAIRDLQDETKGFRAFIPWTFSPKGTKLDSVIMAGGGEYLKMLAISRIYLDNIQNIGSGWVTEGMKVAQVGLHCGANDMGGILMEERVLASTGLIHTTSSDHLRDAIRAAGFIPVQRTTRYERLETV